MLLLVSCQGITSKEPESVLEDYLNAVKQLNFEEAYKYISDSDKKIKNLDQYLKEESNDENNLFSKLFMDDVKYKILETNKKEDKAEIKVEITAPDFTVIISELMGMAFKNAFSGKDMTDEEIDKMLAEKYKEKELPKTTKIETYEMIKEDSWKVFLNWEQKELERKQKKQIQTLLDKAKIFEEKKDYNLAKEQYEKILVFDSENSDAKEGITKSDKQIKIQKEKEEYIKKIQIYEVNSEYYESYLYGKEPKVEFKLKNNGDKSLRKVVVSVYFKDKNGNVIYEEDYYPVLISEFSYDDDKPLKPNYIDSNSYRASDVPSEWEEGSISIKITDIEFE